MKTLSPRQVRALRYAADGMTTKQIAEEMKVGPETIKTHLSAAYRKLGAHTRTRAVKLARDAGYIP